MKANHSPLYTERHRAKNIIFSSIIERADKGVKEYEREKNSRTRRQIYLSC